MMADALYLGIDTGGTGIKFVVTEGDGRVVFDGEVPTDPQSVTASMQRLSQAVAGYLPRLKAMGMACAGIIDPVQGTLGRSPNLPGWQDSPLGEIVTSVLNGLPLTLVNDVNGALYGEYCQGAGRGCANLVMIALGTGVGGGIILDGKLLVGSHHGAGEIGHTMLDPDGPPCACGNRGCLEAYAGSTGILQRARELAADPATPEEFRQFVENHGSGLTTRHLTGLADQGQTTAKELFAWAGEKLGQAVGNLINILDPDRVIVGGGVARAGEHILAPCRATFPPMVLSREAARTPVVMAELGSLAAAVGAAALARQAGAGQPEA
jgi:glucokinase